MKLRTPIPTVHHWNTDAYTHSLGEFYVGVFINIDTCQLCCFDNRFDISKRLYYRKTTNLKTRNHHLKLTNNHILQKLPKTLMYVGIAVELANLHQPIKR